MHTHTTYTDTKKYEEDSLLNPLSTMKPNEQSLEMFFNAILVGLRTCQFPQYVYIQSVKYLKLFEFTNVI